MKALPGKLMFENKKIFLNVVKSGKNTSAPSKGVLFRTIQHSKRRKVDRRPVSSHYPKRKKTYTLTYFFCQRKYNDWNVL